MNRVALLAFVAFVLAGCSNIEHKPRGFANDARPTSQSEARKIVIFFDGTANDEGSDTNIKRLHSLITLQDRGNIASLYLLGVGTNFDAVGAITGSGINARVKIAYEFILNHYDPKRQNPGDEIYIFGFSRGAFAARILTTMLYFAGYVEESKTEHTALRQHTSTEISQLVHDATFPCFGCGDADSSPMRRERLAAALKKEKLQAVLGSDLRVLPVRVKVLGLWDTVEALGLPSPAANLELTFRSTPPKADVDEPNRRYGERLCNVERAYHAVSIDDNRATVFTPLLLSRSHLLAGCPEGDSNPSTSKIPEKNFRSPMLDSKGNIRPGNLQEVWFAGAHSDVGGGYLNSALSGTSLNWMLSLLKEDTGLLPQYVGMHEYNARYVREDIYGSSHDPTAGLWGVLYPRVSRDIVAYSQDPKAMKGFRHVICVHESVFERRLMRTPNDHEYDQLNLTKPEKVNLGDGPYGKGRGWQWSRQSQPNAGHSSSAVDVRQYPDCDFMPPAERRGP